MIRPEVLDAFWLALPDGSWAFLVSWREAGFVELRRRAWVDRSGLKSGGGSRLERGLP